MARIHLFEFEDLHWFPGFLREAMQSYLRTAYGLQKLPDFWVERLAEAMRAQGVERLHDITAGATGPMFSLLKRLKEEQRVNPEVTFSDLFPNGNARTNVAEMYDPKLSYRETPTDAAALPPEMDGVRVLIAGLHHFRPEKARAVLGDAFANRKAICVFEITRNSPPALLSVLFIPFLVLFATPLIRGVGVMQLVFTYLIPILPLVIAWDGLVSHLRTYSVREMEGLVAEFSAPDYRWEFGDQSCPGIPFKLPYLIGLPKS